MQTANCKIKVLFILFLASIILISPPADAKRKKKTKPTKAENAEVQKRIDNFTEEDKRLLDSLSKSQKKKILKGEIDEGFNAWMVKLALGKPFYGTEHHPVYTDYEEVWLYTKPDVREQATERRIIDRQTNWPTLHRKVRTETCTIGDFFILWDRGVVQKVTKATERKVHGSCTIRTREEFLPIVDGKPVYPKNK